MATSPPWLENEGDLKSMCCCCTFKYLGEVILTRENYALHSLVVAASFRLTLSRCRPRVDKILSFQSICALYSTPKSASRTKQQQHMGLQQAARICYPASCWVSWLLMLTYRREDIVKLLWHWLDWPYNMRSSKNIDVNEHSETLISNLC